MVLDMVFSIFWPGFGSKIPELAIIAVWETIFLASRSIDTGSERESFMYSILNGENILTLFTFVYSLRRT